jgi:hypothetical protein
MQLINNSCAVEREAMRRIRGKIDREKKALETQAKS